MKVKRYNYPQQFGDSIEDLSATIRSMLLNGKYILTEDVSEFEKEFAAYTGSKYAIGVNSGTDALILALLAAGVGPGSEVITQANTFNATVAAIVFTGATPILVDAVDSSFLIDVSRVEAVITERTVAIIPVHLYGKPTPMGDLLQLAKQRDLMVIEDAAQAHGARSGEKRVGASGLLGCFSFHPSKNLAAAGDGGIVVTNDSALDQRLRQLRSLGQEGQNNHVVCGLNSKLDAIQALVLRHKLKFLDEWNRGRKHVAKLYRQQLQGLPLTFQAAADDEDHVYHLFQVQTDRRDELMAYLRAREIDATIRYPVPIHLQPAFESFGWRAGQFPVAERLARELLCLPIRPDLPDSETNFVSGCIREFFSSEGARAS